MVLRLLVIMCVVGLDAACDGNNGGGDATGPAEDATSPPDDSSVVEEVMPIDTALPDIGDTNENKDLRNGTMARIGHIVDGDTFDVWVGHLAPKKYVIRMLGLSAPECEKAFVQGTFGGGQACVKDDELYGLASYEALKTMLEGKTVRVTCDVSGNNWCNTDDYSRYLAYVEVDGKDAATEMARGGHAFSYVEFAASKRADICRAEYEARDAKRGIWALGDLNYILSHMSSYTRNWYEDDHDKKCNQAIGN